MTITRIQSTKDVLKVWYFWKYHAIFVFWAIFFIIMLFAYLYTPEYQSTAKVLLLPSTSEGQIISAGEDEKRLVLVSAQNLNTEIELITNDEVLEETIKSFQKDGMSLRMPSQTWQEKIIDNIKKNINEILIFFKLKERLTPFEASMYELQNSLEIEPVAMSNVINVTLQAERPKAAATVLNRLLDIYVKHHNDVFMKEEGIKFYQDRSSEYFDKLQEAEKRLNEFEKKWGIVDLKTQKSANIDMISDLRKKHQEIEMSIEESENRIESLQKALTEDRDQVLITKEMRTIPSIVELEKGLVPLLIERSVILRDFTPNSRKYKDINKQVGTIRGEIKKEVLKAVQTDKLELESLKAKRNSLKDRLAALEAESISFNPKEGTLNNLIREVELQKNNYMLYAAKKENARIFLEKKKRDIANVSIASQASIPVKPVFPNKLLMLIVAVLIGAFSAVGTPFVLEFLDHRIKTVEDAEEALSIPVLSRISDVNNDLLAKEKKKQSYA